jgi:hypothetical protein
MVYTIGKMGIDMKANGNSVWSMGKGQTSSLMGTYTRVSTKMGNLRGKANTNGGMGHSM